MESNKITYYDTISLKEYLERRLDDMDKATKIALSENDKRLDEIKDQHEELHKEVQQLQEFKAELKGKASHQSVLVANILAIIAILVSIAHYLR